MIRYLFIFLLLPALCFATTTSLTAQFDTFADSTNVTTNYGANTQYYIGNRSGDNECNALIRWDYTGIASNVTINSAICTLFCATIENADGWYIRARRLDSAWVEGAGSAAYEFGSASWNNQGHGTACDGSTIAQADSCWGDCGVYAVPPAGGAWSTAVIDSEIINSTSDSTIIMDLTSAVQAQITAGVNYGFHFFGASTVSSRRIQIFTSEYANAAYRPKLYLDYDPPGDSTFLRVRVTVPSAPLTDYPVSVTFLTYPDNASQNITVYDADSTTKLYWYPDSISGHYARIWVINDWAATSENIFIQRVANSAYMKADSVFLLYDDFSTPQVLSQPATDFDNWTLTLRDTANPILTFLPAEWDSLWREQSPIIYDSQESDDAKRYKIFYAGKKQTADPNAYQKIFLGYATAPTAKGPWTKQGVLVTAGGDSINAEDPNFQYLDRWQKWFMIAEDHDGKTGTGDSSSNNSRYYFLGLWTADSLDGTWTKFGRICDSTAAGYPANAFAREPASPAWWCKDIGQVGEAYNFSEDTCYCYYEAFNATSYIALLVSYGDSVGYVWHRTDSTGAVNETEPSPIFGLAGQGQTGSKPDAGPFKNDDGQFWLMGISSVGAPSYKGTHPYNLVYQTPDSARVSQAWGFDSETGYYVGTSDRDTISGWSNQSAAFLTYMLDFDSTRWANTKWTLKHRAAKYSTWRPRGSWTTVADGQLTLTASPRVTSSTTLQSTTELPANGYVIEIKMAATGIDNGYEELLISLGDDTLQDYVGSQSINAAWFRTTPQRGYSIYIASNGCRFYKDTLGTGFAGLGSTGSAIGLDTMHTLHEWEIRYTTGDSLLCYLDNSRLVTAAKNTVWNAVTKQLSISQGALLDSTRGSVAHIDWVRVRKFTTADGSALASDTLYATPIPEQVGIQRQYDEPASFIRSRIR